MKSVPKLIRRFVGIMMLSMMLLFIVNIVFYAVVYVKNTPSTSAWEVAEQTAAALQTNDTGYVLPDEVAAELNAQNIWVILIDNDTHQVIWQTANLPNTIPMQYTLSDISDLSRGYIDGYPTFTGEAESGLLVLGYPKDSYWKLMHANWEYEFIATLPRTILLALAMNIALILLIYTAANTKLLRSIKPITNGIHALSGGEPVSIKESGVLSELAVNLNKTSAILQKQKEQLRKRETARANWIAGVSHDIRTPLSMVMGYAGQLERSPNILAEERKKAAVIVKQSQRMKNLINDLNLASKLEYDMQPVMRRPENAVAIVRQVVVDFINMDIEDRFKIQWTTDEALSVCSISTDRDLLKRAITNMIQNSINHNERGCEIYVSVSTDNSSCIIRVEDNGIGATDEQIEQINHAPHYMVCDANITGQSHGLGLLIVKQITDGHNGKTIMGHSSYGGFKTELVIPKQ